MVTRSPSIRFIGDGFERSATAGSLLHENEKPALMRSPGGRITVVVLGVALVALFFAGLNDRFNTMSNPLQSGFFRGGALFVFVLAIVVAALRLAGFTYVRTVLDTAARHVVAFTLGSDQSSDSQKSLQWVGGDACVWSELSATLMKANGRNVYE